MQVSLLFYAGVAFSHRGITKAHGTHRFHRVNERPAPHRQPPTHRGSPVIRSPRVVARQRPSSTSRTVSSLGPPASKLTWDFGTLGGNLNISNQFFSSAIAPGANFANTAPINGSIFVNSYLNGQGEIHDKDGGYVVQHNGFNPLAVPEPSTLVFSALGAIGGGLLAARRGRIR